ncbi:hypothetical protein V500_10891 [Pseudogymnoascus sp. VKM F-4518 (FW-2643)]|nr:hypothetical protein V500_10891 [Pseudogymnoascus sp. VKM F-4518 (FW-2643)]
MALIYRSDSARRKAKKSKPRQRKPKFPKETAKGKKAAPKETRIISQPFDPILGTAHRDNRLNEFFGIDPSDLLPRSESLPHLSQWISAALVSIAYECSKAHHLTKKICFPQVGWKKIKQRMGFREHKVLTHVLRNIATSFKRLRDHYMDANAPPVVECLEESDLLWQNILEPITGIVQIVSEVIFRGVKREIHRIDGLKLARAIRILGEELNHTAKMLDSMIGMIATRWTDRTVVMAIETAQKWRADTIKRWGLEGLYDETQDSENDAVKNFDRARLLAKASARELAKDSQGEPAAQAKSEAGPSGTAKKGGPAVQAKNEAGPSGSSNKAPILKKAPKVPRPRGPSVFLPQPPVVYNEMDAAYFAREKAMKEREEREYSERCALRTAMENLDDDELPVTKPTGHIRVYAAAKKSKPHHGLLMDDQDMELDPLRMAQLKGVGHSGHIPSYSSFPSAHLTDNRTRTETVSQRSDRHVKQDKGKTVERRSALKKDRTITPESSKLAPPPQQSGSEKEALKHSEVQAPLINPSDHIVTQVKGLSIADRENRVTEKSVTSGRAQRHGEVAKAGTKSGKEEEPVTPRNAEEIKQRPRVRFADSTPQDEEASKGRTSGEAGSSRSGSRAGGESSRSGSRKVGESGSSRTTGGSRSSRSGGRSSSSRNAGVSSPNHSGRPFPIPLRVGDDVIPAPPKSRSNRSPIVDNHGVGLHEGRSMMPDPLKLSHTRSNSPRENLSARFPDDQSLMPRPLNLSRTRSQSPLQNSGVGLHEGGNLVPPKPKFGHTRSKSPLDNRGVGFGGPSNTRSPLANVGDVLPLPPKLGHTLSKSSRESRGGAPFTTGVPSQLSVVSFADYGSSPSGPPPDRPLPPIPSNRK